jgi:EAL domain-containing protein (putative c-di-GMP-specific phosphodiesterase class I)
VERQAVTQSGIEGMGDTELLGALHDGIGAGELSLVYQPLVRSGDGRTLGAEALLRWDRGGLGPVSPATFIPVAEGGGLMPQIGEWVLVSALQQLAKWREGGLPKDFVIHVNLSLPELLSAELAGTVGRTLRELDLNPRQLCFELTEPVLRAGGAPAETALYRLVDLGVLICLDDFGTSSSIAALTRYEFDYAKVGRGLIGGLDSPAHRARLVRGLLGMARALGTTLIAEGIEEGDEIDRIAALGIVKVQGFATGRPATAEELSRVLAGERFGG